MWALSRREWPNPGRGYHHFVSKKHRLREWLLQRIICIKRYLHGHAATTLLLMECMELKRRAEIREAAAKGLIAQVAAEDMLGENRGSIKSIEPQISWPGAATDSAAHG